MSPTSIPLEKKKVKGYGQNESNMKAISMTVKHTQQGHDRRSSFSVGCSCYSLQLPEKWISWHKNFWTSDALWFVFRNQSCLSVCPLQDEPGFDWMWFASAVRSINGPIDRQLIKWDVSIPFKVTPKNVYNVAYVLWWHLDYIIGIWIWFLGMLIGVALSV